MDFYVMARTYNMYGGNTTLSLIPDYLLGNADEFGKALSELTIEKGAVIESGQTVAGIDENSKWRCQFEKSLLEPKRDVLDLNPGKRHAAGKR